MQARENNLTTVKRISGGASRSLLAVPAGRMGVNCLPHAAGSVRKIERRGGMVLRTLCELQPVLCNFLGTVRSRFGKQIEVWMVSENEDELVFFHLWECGLFPWASVSAEQLRQCGFLPVLVQTPNRKAVSTE